MTYNYHRRPIHHEKRGMNISNIVLMIAGLMIVASFMGVNVAESITNAKDKVNSQLRALDSDNVYNDWAIITGNVDEKGIPIPPQSIDIPTYDIYGSSTVHVFGNSFDGYEFMVKEGSSPTASFRPVEMNIYGIDGISQRMRLFVGEWSPSELTIDGADYELKKSQGTEWRCLAKLGLTEFDATCGFEFHDVPKGKYTLLMETEYMKNGQVVPYVGDSLGLKLSDLLYGGEWVVDKPVTISGDAHKVVLVFDVPEDL